MEAVYKWATWRHNNKPKRWIVGRYFGKFNKFRNDRWVFGDRDSGAYLVKFSWTAIRRHVPVKGAASPDDPALAGYWAERRKKVKPPLDSYTLRLLTRQDGLCPLCGDPLLNADQPPQSPEQWERWWLHVTRKAIAASYLTHHGRPGPAADDQTRLVHASCQRELQARQRRKPEHSFSLQRPRGLLEPCAGTTRTHGSEGAGARQRVPATRPASVTSASAGSNVQLPPSAILVRSRSPTGPSNWTRARLPERSGTHAGHLAGKYGMTIAQAEQASQQMTQHAAADGLEFRFDLIRGGNTFDAHRLLHLAKEHGLQPEMKERLLRATFTEGLPISDKPVLARLAVEAGLPAAQVQAVLDGDNYADASEPTSSRPHGTASPARRSSSPTASTRLAAHSRPRYSCSSCSALTTRQAKSRPLPSRPAATPKRAATATPARSANASMRLR